MRAYNLMTCNNEFWERKGLKVYKEAESIPKEESSPAGEAATYIEEKVNDKFLKLIEQVYKFKDNLSDEIATSVLSFKVAASHKSKSSKMSTLIPKSSSIS